MTLVIPQGRSAPFASRWLLWAIAITFLAHAPFALFNSEFQDGWIHALLYERGDYAQVSKHLLDNGRPIAGWINLHAMTAMGFAHGAIWLSVISAVVAAAAWYATFIRTGRISPRLAFVMAVLSVVTPANQIILSTPTVIFVSAHAFFAVGMWLFLEAHLRTQSVSRSAIYLVACASGVMAALLGESTTPMLLLYPLVTLFSDGVFDNGHPFEWRRVALILFKRSTPVVLGSAAFSAMFFLFPPVGEAMVSERRLSLQPFQLMLSFSTFAVTVLVAYLPFWIALFWMKNKTGNGQRRNWVSQERLFLLLLASATALFSLTPYIAALRLASPSGWGLRYLYYFGSSLAWLLACLITARDENGRLTLERRWVLWLTAAIVIGLLARWPFFAIRNVQEDMVMQAAATSPAVQSAHVVVLDDPTEVMAAPRRDWEWTGLLQREMSRPGAVAGISYPREAESTFAYWRLEMRKRMGWAPSVAPTMTPEYIRGQIQMLEGHGLVSLKGDSCRAVLLTVKPSTLGWSIPALVWYFRSVPQPEAYRQWLKSRATTEVTISEISQPLSSCH